jgi:hypothetical protein
LADEARSERDRELLKAVAAPRVDLTGTDQSWAFAASSTAAYGSLSSKQRKSPMELACMRRLEGALTDSEDAVKLDVVVDEGAEVNCVTAAALRRAMDDFQNGYAPFCQREDIGKPHLVYAQKGIQIQAFHGADARCGLMAFVHLRVGRAMYPIHAVVTPGLPTWCSA